MAFTSFPWNVLSIHLTTYYISISLEVTSKHLEYPFFLQNPFSSFPSLSLRVSLLLLPHCYIHLEYSRTKLKELITSSQPLVHCWQWIHKWGWYLPCGSSVIGFSISRAIFPHPNFHPLSPAAAPDWWSSYLHPPQSILHTAGRVIFLNIKFDPLHWFPIVLKAKAKLLNSL